MNLKTLTVVAVTLVIAACGQPDASSSSDDAHDTGLRGTLVDSQAARPDFTLTDTGGDAYRFRQETEGLLAFLFFGYTNCPDVCPIHMSTLAAAIGRLDPSDRGRIRVVFVSTDPERDTPERLREWLDAFDRGFIGLRGTLDEVNAIKEGLGLPHAAVPEHAGESYIVGHAAAVLAFTPDGHARVRYPFGTRQEDWGNDLPLLLEWEDHGR